MTDTRCYAIGSDGFPDFVTQIINSVVQGDKTTIDVHWTDARTGDHAGVKTTDKGIDLYGVRLSDIGKRRFKSRRKYYHGYPTAPENLGEHLSVRRCLPAKELT